MGNKAKIAIAILVLLAVILGVAAYVISMPSSRIQPPAKYVPTSTPPAGVAVVVASKPLTAGQPIPAESLKVLHYPQFPSGAYHQTRSVIGQVPVTSIGAGVPVLHSNMVSGLATQVPAGNLAMAIRVNEEIAVGDHLHPGDFVDVFTTLPGNEGQMHGGWPTQSRLLLAGLRVLAVGPQTVAHGLQPVAGQQGDNGIVNGQNANGQQQPPSTVVLQVPVASAATLALASAQGHLLLALRNPKSTGMPDVQDFPIPTPALIPTKIPLSQRKAALQKPENRAYAGLTLPGLAGKSKAEAQAMRPLPPPPPMMQVYNGSQKTAVPY